MSDFIQMSCPSCGGHIQVQKDMQKFFCVHCGNELILKQDNEGILTPIKARDLQASAKLKEINLSLTAMDLLKSQIMELENQVKQIRKTFLEHSPKSKSSFLGYEFSKHFSDYEKEKKLPYKIKDVFYENTHYDFEKWKEFIKNGYIPGYNTAEELIDFYQFLAQPQYSKDKFAITMMNILEPLRPLSEELKLKKARLNKMLEKAIEQDS